MSWLDFAVIAVLIGGFFVGNARGLVKMVLGFSAMIIAIVGCNVVAPMITQAIDEHTEIRANVSTKVREYLDEQLEGKLSNVSQDKQNAIIDKMSIPDNVKEVLKEKNNTDTYIELGVNNFEDYVCNFVAKTVLGALIYVIIFVVIFIAVRVVFVVLDIASHLPLIHSINKLAGGILGVAEGLIIVWVFFAVATASIDKEWGFNVVTLIGQSKMLTLLYSYNFVLSTIIKMIV